MLAVEIKMNLSVVITLSWMSAIFLIYAAIYLVIKYSFLWHWAFARINKSEDRMLTSIIDLEDSDSGAEIV